MAEERGNIINRLSELTSNQIAAGEVVLRPSSVVKELLENAVDAGAKVVTLIVKDGGKSLIQVIDDGCGMSYDDALTAFERHATSKIKESDDLFALTTFGFRGEALPSIASVAVVELKTMREGDELGARVAISGGRLEEHERVHTQVGTQFTVKNLFYNVPARRKFMKGVDTEVRHIISEFKKVALCHNNISFIMYNNDNCIYSLPATNLRNRVSDVINDRVSRLKGRSKLVDIETSTSMVEIKGFVSRPDMAQQNPEQYLFINGRYFKSNRLNKAIMAAYENLLPTSKHKPIYFLYMSCSPSEVDVNVSPSKTEVRFENEESIAQILKAALLGALGKNGIIPMIDFDAASNIEIPLITPSEPSYTVIDVEVDPLYKEPEERGNYDSFEKIDSISFTNEDRVVIPEIHASEEFIIDTNTQFDNIIETFEDFMESAEEEETILSSSSFNEADNEEIVTRVEESLFEGISNLMSIGETTLVDDKYLLTTVDSDIYIINIKRAMSRIMYDRYSEVIDNSELQRSHKMLFPPIITLQPSDMLLIVSSKSDLESMGFALDIDEARLTVEVVGVPVDMGECDPYQLFEDIIDSLRSDDDMGYNSEKRDRLIITMSRLASTHRYGSMAKKDLKEIVEALLKSDNYSFSPTGKAIMVKIGLIDIKRLLG